LMSYFDRPVPGQIRAVPGAGLHVPIYLLGSSDFSAQLAAKLGLPFAFASHFAPEYLHVALKLYRENFQPGVQLDRPHAMVGVNVFATDTDAEARRLFTSLQQQFLNLIRGTPGETPPPVESMEGRWLPHEQAHVDRMMRYSIVGSPQTVRDGLERLIADTDADEIIATGSMFDHAARLRSFEITANVFREINKARRARQLVLSQGARE
jgi:luciferase family oxidoreductase group 1